MDISKNQFSSIQEMTGQLLAGKPQREPIATEQNGLRFEDILSQKQAETAGRLKFSKHANERLVTRNIDLSMEQLKRLESGTDRARAKGIRESLVMVDDVAFIVNVKNNTVITAVGDADDAVFTNIDGAVIS